MLKRYIKSLKKKNIHIIGISSTEGVSIALFLIRYGIKNFTVHDFIEEKDWFKYFNQTHSALTKKQKQILFKKLQKIPAHFNFKDNYLKNIKKADLIFVPQSWYIYNINKQLKKIYKKNPEIFTTITQLYFNLISCPIIAVTGSNGKTTTANLIYKILKTCSKKKIYFSGNDRLNIQILNKLEKIKKNNLVVLEVSNRQLKIDLKKSPHIGIITNITPNHLNEYKSFRQYSEQKENLIKYQTKNDYAILNYDDKESQRIIKSKKYNVFGFSIKQELDKGCYIKKGNFVLKDKEEKIVCSIYQLKLKGEHNLSNACAAIACAYLSGIKIKNIVKALNNFKTVSKRIELIYKINGIEFYDDTSSTTPESTIACLKVFPEQKIILISGGKNKGLNYNKLAQIIKKKVKEIIFIKSPLSKEIKKLLIEKKMDKKKIHQVENLKQAVNLSYQLALKNDHIILSPAGVYYAYFQNKMSDYKLSKYLIKKLLKLPK